jgi:dodecin
MSVAKVVELMAESPKGWEDATQQALQMASKTLRGIRSIWICNMQALVENDTIRAYRVNVKITFEVDEAVSR